MSSTNRGGDRHVSDYYITPQKPIIDMLEQLKQDIPFIAEPHRALQILDPCAGGDPDNPLMAYPEAIKTSNLHAEIETMDIRPNSSARLIMDYLTQPMDGYDIIITNPPFNEAEAILEKALKEAGNYVILLLRLNFWGSIKRHKLLTENPPAYCYIHPRRMSFTPDGNTDSIEYAHFVWDTRNTPKHTITKLLPL